ncbi:DNA primase, partial [mine drainage metagenome]
MRRDSLGFSEAAELLASEYSVTLEMRPGGDEEAARRQESRTRSLRLLEEAQAQFARQLTGPEGEGARIYLVGRGIGPDDFARFELGWAPGASAISRALGAKGEHLVEAGISQRSDDGRVYDRFRERVTFAIRDRSNRIVGFGGRTLGDAQPKYLNSAESPLFLKRSILYA